MGGPEATLTTTVDALVVEPLRELAAEVATQLDELHVRPSIASSAAEAIATVTARKFEAVFVSLDLPHVEQEAVMRATRDSPSNSHVPIVALASSEQLRPLARACRAGATHYLMKPLVDAQVRRLLEPLYAAMVEERRRYQRAAMSFPVLCRRGVHQQIAFSVNLSASGLLLREIGRLQRGDRLHLTFPFHSNVDDPFVVEATVTRVPSEAAIAVGFTDLPADEFERMKQWVEMSLSVRPGVVN